MRTLLSDPPPDDFEALLERRRQSGADRYDEVWEGVLHIMPTPRGRHGDIQQQLAVLLNGPARAAGLHPMAGFNLGDPDDYRIPDGGLLVKRADAVYYETAALAIEVVSLGDETWEKLAFYAGRGVTELLLVDPRERAVQWFGLARGEYRPVERSGLIDLGPAELAERLDWPPLEP